MNKKKKKKEKENPEQDLKIKTLTSKIAELKWLQLGIRVCKARNCEGIVRNKIDERMTGANETREQQEKTQNRTDKSGKNRIRSHHQVELYPFV